MFTFADWNMWEDVPAWKEASLGSAEARLQMLADPKRRPGLRANDPTGALTNDWKDVFIVTVKNPEFKNMKT